MYLESEQALREVFGFAKGRAKAKQLPSLEKHSIHFIKQSPFVSLATFAKSGQADCSPRGGQPGFVKVLNNKTLIIPEAKGNNRLDSLVNIIETGTIGCLFFIPGLDETLRINGQARISTKTEYLQYFSQEKNPIKACIEITINEVFLHCAKAFMRAKFWHSESQIDRQCFPTMGQMIKDQLALDEQVESHEQMIARYQKDL